MFATNRVLIPLAKPKKSPRKPKQSERRLSTSSSNAKKKAKKKHASGKHSSENQSSGFSLNFVTESIPQYNSLLDKHLVNYYGNPNIDFMLSFDERKNRPKPLKRHSYVNVLGASKKKKKKDKKELKKVIDFIERENDKVRIRRNQIEYMSDKEKLKFKKAQKHKERMRRRFVAVPVHVRSYILTFLTLKESLQLVQVFGCQSLQETWRLFLITYYKLMVYPIFSEEQLVSTNAGGGVTMMESVGAVTPRGAPPRGTNGARPTINYYQVFKSCYYNRQSKSKFFTCVRLRPFILKEYERCFTRMPDLEDEGATPKVVVEHPVNGRKHAFQGFDNVFWSHSARVNYADQQSVFHELGPKILTPLWTGSNVTLFAYGTSKSGKTYQIFGTDTQPGLLPRCAEMIFASVAMNQDPDVDVSVHVSMLELSGGHIVDMFDTSGAPLELINDPVNGAYVDGLKVLPVNKWNEMRKIIELQRDENRSCVDTTKRHTIFQITLMQTKYVSESEAVSEERVSTVSFVDLGACGKEDETQTFGVGHALTNLHEVITCLRQSREQKKARKELRAREKKKGKKGVSRAPLPAHLANPISVPFRMSHLTCLLQEGIDRNSRVLFVGCLAPSEYAESIKTLEYISTLKKEAPFAIVGGSKVTTPSASRPESPHQRSVATAESDQELEGYLPRQGHVGYQDRAGRGQNHGIRSRKSTRAQQSVYGGRHQSRRPVRTQTVQDYHRAGGPLSMPPGGRSHFRHRAGIQSSNRLGGAKTALGTVRRAPGQKEYVSLKRASEPINGFLPKIGGGRRNDLYTR
uniref:Kinesin motor domain-containing protein n=1 Tax=Percolomonas cosmopolitus TaxID=63605 RepID=A0A7S1PHQ1_9EUKA